MSASTFFKLTSLENSSFKEYGELLYATTGYSSILILGKLDFTVTIAKGVSSAVKFKVLDCDFDHVVIGLNGMNRLGCRCNLQSISVQSIYKTVADDMLRLDIL